MAKEKDINVTTAEAQSWESVEAREAAQAAQDQQQHVYNQAQPLTEKWWVWELFACFVCTAAFLGMVGFLAPYDQKPVPNWVLAQNFKGHTLGFSVSINSILSIFSTIVKSSLLIPVAAGISQLKWLWFSDGHKLSDFQLFEAAKGGPLGSILILWNMRGRNLVCLGALIIVGSLALDFSFQQLVAYPPVPVAVQTAYMPATPTYSNFALTAPSGIGGIPYKKPDSKMTSALKIGVDGIDASVNVVPDCPSGNCTWTDTYASIGVCSQCFDATPKIIESCGSSDIDGTSTRYCNYSYTGDYSFDDGIQLSGIYDSSGLQRIFGAGSQVDSSLSLFFKDIKSPIAILQTLGITQGNQTIVKAHGTECALFYCVKKYSGSVNQTVFHETLIDTYRDNAATYDLGEVQEDGSQSGTGNFQITAPGNFMKGTSHNGSYQFVVTSDAASALTYFFYTQSSIAGDITQTPTLHTSSPSNFIAYIWPLDTAGYSTVMNYISGNITNAMRMSNLVSALGTNAAGIVWQDKPKVNVVWYWIIVPGVLILLSFLFLILTMCESARRGAILWKSSPLAAFHHPLTREGRLKLTQASSPRQLEKIAAEITVKAEKTEKGHRLVEPLDE